MLNISIRNGDKYYRAAVTPRWARLHDNGALVSCGLTVGQDLHRNAFRRLLAAGMLVEVSGEEYNHSSCLSSCTRRGDAVCRW